MRHSSLSSRTRAVYPSPQQELQPSLTPETDALKWRLLTELALQFARNERSGPTNHMLTIDLKQLNKNVGPAVFYLRSRLDEPVKINGSRVKLTDTSARAAKLLLRKFLRQLRLEGYRVLSVNSGLNRGACSKRRALPSRSEGDR